MTREEAKYAAEVMMAYAEGKEIEFSIRENKIDEWYGYDIHSQPTFNWDKCEFRIKKGPTYRPFKNKEECWEEMQKHQPFGWIKNKQDAYLQITTIYGVVTINDRLTSYTFTEFFNKFSFIDGTPFGIKEE